MNYCINCTLLQHTKNVKHADTASVHAKWDRVLVVFKGVQYSMYSICVFISPAADALPTPQRGPVISPPSSQPSPSLKKFGLVEIEFSDLEFEGKVGSGGFGTVSKGRWISKNDIVAIKVLVELEEREVSYEQILCVRLYNAGLSHHFGSSRFQPIFRQSI